MTTTINNKAIVSLRKSSKIQSFKYAYMGYFQRVDELGNFMFIFIASVAEVGISTNLSLHVVLALTMLRK